MRCFEFTDFIFVCFTIAQSVFIVMFSFENNVNHQVCACMCLINQQQLPIWSEYRVSNVHYKRNGFTIAKLFFSSHKFDSQLFWNKFFGSITIFLRTDYVCVYEKVKKNNSSNAHRHKSILTKCRAFSCYIAANFFFLLHFNNFSFFSWFYLFGFAYTYLQQASIE